MSSLYTRDVSSMMNGKHVFDQLAAQQKFNPVLSNLYSLSLASYFFLVIRVIISSTRRIKSTRDSLFAHIRAWVQGRLITSVSERNAYIYVYFDRSFLAT